MGALDGVVQDFGSPPFQLYEFMDGSAERWQRQTERGPLPWFANPEIKIRFFRPISSGLLALDYALFGHRTWGYRIDATFWYLVLVVSYGLWVRRIIPLTSPDPLASSTPRRDWHPAAMLALLIFVVSDTNWINILWSAGRWVLVSTALTLLGCVFYTRWRSDEWRPGLYLSVLTFTAGFLSGEVALAILAFPLAGEVFCPARERAGRLKGISLLSILAIGYLVFYKVGGYGGYGSNAYLNPMEEPPDIWSFSQVVSSRCPESSFSGSRPLHRAQEQVSQEWSCWRFSWPPRSARDLQTCALECWLCSRVSRLRCFPLRRVIRTFGTSWSR